ncbi:MAG: hypothetical protein COT15_04220 [Candidatus Diapherotrites archaeon CG08_land_8_20_14_0_20_34_12]|nr:MAG: hypothetical protein COT15_04220 [Candidatus Diapherotrites archaeon CG08_land_8_20_14_0_20_34_12]
MQENLRDIRRISKDIIKYLNISNIIKHPIYKNGYEVTFSRHAARRTIEKGISADLIEKAIKEGYMLKFGKNRVKIGKRFKEFEVICVDEIVGNRIKIVTVVKKGG